jgi:nucleoside-diphosphate-sugar epimerase
LKIAVLGATGFLGKHLVRAIIRDTSLGVLAVSRTPPTSSTPGLQIIHPRELSEALPSVDVIVNCAVDYGRTSHIDAYVANLEWPLSVIKQASQLGVSFVNINTFYGKFPLALYSPLRTYSLTKALLELTGPELYAREKKRGHCSYFDLRVEHLYGPGDSTDKFIPWVLGQMRNQVANIDLTHGQQKRDFITVEDAASMILSWLQNIDTIDADRSLEIGTSRAAPLSELVVLASQISGFKGSLNFGSLDLIPGEIESSSADPFLGKALGMSFESLQSGLTRTWNEDFK